MTIKSGRTSQRTNDLRDESCGGDELRQVTKVWCIIAPIEIYSSYRFSMKKASVAIIDALILFIFIHCS